MINEYKAQTESKYGAHCYASPNDYDIWPDKRAFLPFNSEWFQSQDAGPYWLLVPGKEDPPKDLVTRQIAMFADKMPYWEERRRCFQIEAAKPDNGTFYNGGTTRLAIQDNTTGVEESNAQKLLFTPNDVDTSQALAPYIPGTRGEEPGCDDTNDAIGANKDFYSTERTDTSPFSRKNNIAVRESCQNSTCSNDSDACTIAGAISSELIP